MDMFKQLDFVFKINTLSLFLQWSAIVLVRNKQKFDHNEIRYIEVRLYNRGYSIVRPKILSK